MVLTLSAVFLATFGLAGCGSGAPAIQAAATQAAAAPVVTAADLPEPAPEDVVLRIGGGASNSDDGLLLSLKDIERLGTQEVTVYEPFVAKEVTFTAVPWESVLALAELPEDVVTLHTVAYNEYEVDVPVDVGDTPGAWLATRQDGEPIAVADGGPTRVVFSEDHPGADDESLWIWSIALIEPA